MEQDLIEAKKYISEQGYGSGTNYTTNLVAVLLANYSRMVVNKISSKPVLADSGCDGCRYFNSCGIRIDYGNGGCDEKEL